MCSVVIPCRNRHKSLLSAVRSAATMPIINEVIIVDDGSIPSITARSFSAIRGAEKIKIISNSRAKGAQGARVSGALYAKNDIVVFLDSDDVLLCQGVIDLYDALVADQDSALVYGNVTSAHWSSDFLQLTGDVYRQVLKNLSLCCFSGIVARKSRVPWDELDLYLPAWQDDDFTLTVSRRHKIKFVHTYSAWMGGSGDSISSSKRKQLIGLTRMLKKWGCEIKKEFGWKMLVLWRIRQGALAFFALSQLLSSKSQKFRGFGYMLTKGSRVAWRIGEYLIERVRHHFDRIYA
jgi:glycosyltransferase involved in cell wall biosynthesis